MDTRSPQVSIRKAAPVALWNPEEDDTLVCLDVQQETHDVKTFTFASPEGKRFAFKAGQYFLFDLDHNGEAESRCYSISSSPHRTNAFSVTVKRVPGGKISNWLHDTLVVGASVKANGPLGDFVRSETGRKLLLLSGGSGITPVMSILREIADSCEPANVVFMHAARRPQDLIFRDELACIARRLKGLRLHLLPETVAGEASWPGLTGRISAEYMRLAVPDIAERTVMCCGPAPFMAAARRIAGDLGVPALNYVEESFDAAVIDEPEMPAVQEAAIKVFQVSFAKQARSIEVSGDQSVLSCAKKAGVRIPSSCANGVCGTCKSKLISGTVDMNHNGGIRQREIDAGLFLPCCSKPLSDLIIER
ncbi:2Fe-2S iron-sulfur cluster binding domain-containing protein [Rhizobium lentis]|uniref:FAD-binding oxidoreductase n=1 Tax=Rhizobium lentis TaxID=1138194 RepID=UPI001C83E196|nr:FAD-binding oxidoreductase [Rhizobium lentis]MBX4976819.1 2Fe-2S iron-sulfur cluster binding domain-containing protein [Rhizobium lentis]MBX5012654.1 2Fe-2S iron-sulfur cluster binding domain-containing protein [Rhizobium lentis]MBX5039536.1 2Fe-2S iron-sulfur cluster binding domain-containing protein [Rhizobium lentis]MBX5052073.1 2Fe-2S iron-sulfur cluster binding domain-containing protein [Rhizobium lentis]MBX5071727.1 2Fe-2S iron-sulfur cluster binding domain-containing protein [Rhizobi